jgi:CheY-like chemotaxis protein
MDCNMPVMDGYKATEAIRKYEKENGLREIFIAAVTADNYVQNKIACLKAGMNCFISKPVTKMKVDRIMDMLREYIPS